MPMRFPDSNVRKATPIVWAHSYPSPHVAALPKYRLESKSDLGAATANKRDIWSWYMNYFIYLSHRSYYFYVYIYKRINFYVYIYIYICIQIWMNSRHRHVVGASTDAAQLASNAGARLASACYGYRRWCECDCCRCHCRRCGGACHEDSILVDRHL